MRVTRLICTPDNPIGPPLLALLHSAGISYTLECWSFKGWHCPVCSRRLARRFQGPRHVAYCMACGVENETTTTPEGLYICTSPVHESPLPAA